MTSKIMMKLLPIQILFAAIGAVNGIVSSYFASNYIGVDAMSAVGLYSPITMLLTAISTILVGGSAFLAGKYIGQNLRHKVMNVFTLDIIFSVIVALLITAVITIVGSFGLTSFFTTDPEVQEMFNKYLLGQAIGIVPLILGNQLTIFLSMENKKRISVIASVVYIFTNLFLNFLFVEELKMQAFGLALASSVGMWVFCIIESLPFIFGNSFHHLDFDSIDFKEGINIVTIGFPGAESQAYQTIRGLVVNKLLYIFVGSVGVSAFAASNNLMTLFWSIPLGMIAVSRLLISVATGEEDRQTLLEIMRGMLYRYIPLMCAVCVIIIACARPFTMLFYRDPNSQVFIMTMWGFRILPLCMPFSILLMHYTNYVHAMDRHFILHTLTVIDGVLGVVICTLLLIKPMGMNSVYVANVLNGVLTTITIVIYSTVMTGHFPKDMKDLMAMPAGFGVSKDERMDIAVHDIKEVTAVAEKIQSFCVEKGIDKRRAYLAGLSMEEMAGNVVDHGFTKDNKQHSIDIRVIHKADEVILRIKDDCIPFDPKARLEMSGEGDNADVTKNIGIRMIYKLAESVNYQNILGLNILTLKI